MLFRKLFISSALVFLLVGCASDTESESYFLGISFYPSSSSLLEWSISASAIFDYYGFDYSPEELEYYQYDSVGRESASLSELDWLFWDLGGIDSYITGSLSFREIETQINLNNPILLEYRSDGFFQESRFFIVYGYDYLGRVYLHEPGYGLRIVPYSELFKRHSFGVDYYWDASLILG